MWGWQNVYACIKWQWIKLVTTYMYMCRTKVSRLSGGFIVKMRLESIWAYLLRVLMRVINGQKEWWREKRLSWIGEVLAPSFCTFDANILRERRNNNNNKNPVHHSPFPLIKLETYFLFHSVFIWIIYGKYSYCLSFRVLLKNMIV